MLTSQYKARKSIFVSLWFLIALFSVFVLDVTVAVAELRGRNFAQSSVPKGDKISLNFILMPGLGPNKVAKVCMKTKIFSIWLCKCFFLILPIVIKESQEKQALPQGLYQIQLLVHLPQRFKSGRLFYSIINTLTKILWQFWNCHRQSSCLFLFFTNTPVNKTIDLTIDGVFKPTETININFWKMFN